MAGRLVHFELPAADTGRAREFWGGLFGWEFSSWSGPVEYHVTEAGGEPGGAIYPTASGLTGPIVYFDVDEIGEALARVTELGGEVVEGRAPISGVGWFARCRDSEGNVFSLFQADDSARA